MVYSPENPLSINWDKSFEQDLPDCRLTGSRRRSTETYLGNMKMEKVFCANCGSDGGMVTAEWTPHIFFICDGCYKYWGSPAGCQEVKVDNG